MRNCLTQLSSATCYGTRDPTETYRRREQQRASATNNGTPSVKATTYFTTSKRYAHATSSYAGLLFNADAASRSIHTCARFARWITSETGSCELGLSNA